LAAEKEERCSHDHHKDQFCGKSAGAVISVCDTESAHKAEEGGYWAEVPALPGCVSQGETVDDVRANVREAIEGWLLAEEGTTQADAADRVLEVTV